MSPEIQGFILAGGHSSRFGTDKALACLGGKTLLGRAVAAVRALGIEPRVVVPDPSPYLDTAAAFVVGERPDLGPAEGLRVALEAAEADRVLMLTTDMPRVDADTLRALLAASSDSHPVVCYRTDRVHPFPGCYRRSLLEVIPDPPGSLQTLIASVSADFLDPGDPRSPRGIEDRLANVNRPEDLRREARRR